MKNDDQGIFRRLQSEHREVSGMIAKLKKGGRNGTQRRDLFPRMRAELLAHARAEQKVVYERFRGLGDELRGCVKDGIEEHQQIEEILGTLSALGVDDAKWSECLEGLEECVEHHVNDEEQKVFPLAKKHVDAKTAREIERKYLQAKQAEMKRLGNGERFGDLTRDELYARARELDIPGRSKMTKDELQRELRGR